MSIELPVTFVEGALHHDLLNQQFAALLSAANDLLARVETLEGDSTTPDLSAYATVVQLNEHVAETVPHSAMVKWGAGTALAGADYVSGGAVRIEAAEVTLVAGAGTFTYGTAFTGGVLSVQVSVHGATARAVAFDGVTLADVDLIGTGTDVLFVTVIGWDS